MKNNRLSFKFVIFASGFKYFYRISIFILNQTYPSISKPIQSISKHLLPPPTEKKWHIFLKNKTKTVILNSRQPKKLRALMLLHGSICMRKTSCKSDFASID